MGWKKFFYFAEKHGIDLSKINVSFFGYTFKENCSDIRNTKVKELIFSIKKKGIKISLWDPLMIEEDLISLEKKESKFIETYRKK